MKVSWLRFLACILHIDYKKNRNFPRHISAGFFCFYLIVKLPCKGFFLYNKKSKLNFTKGVFDIYSLRCGTFRDGREIKILLQDIKHCDIVMVV